MIDPIRSIVMKRRWKDNAPYRKKMNRILKSASHKKKVGRVASKKLKKLWENSAFKKRMAKLSSERMKKRWKTPKFRKLMNTGLKSLWKTSKYRDCMSEALRGIHISKPQLSLFKRLCRAGVKGLKLEHAVGSYSLDIALPDKKLGIEVDGSYWHKIRKRRAKLKRTRFLNSEGWEILRVDSGKTIKKFEGIKSWLLA